jgi:phospholipid-binding lipoprotein MlaA
MLQARTEPCASGRAPAPAPVRAAPAFAAALALVALLALGGCATTQTLVTEARGGPGARLDPWENWNRKVFSFNEGLDEKVLKPVATAYAKVVPQFVRRSVDNFFANAADGWSAINNILQGKAEPALQDVVRFTTNSVFGIFGILDIASEFGLEHHYEDFGQTLGRWGFGAGAYVVWPLLGPSTVRDSIALPLDRSASPALVINSGGTQSGITFLQIVNTRANLLGASRVIDDIALDKYTFIRDAYLQRRRSLIFDGDAPEVPDASAPAGTPPADAASGAAAAGASGAAPVVAPSPARPGEPAPSVRPGEAPASAPR